MVEILLSVLALGLLIMLITKKGRVMLKGFFGLFITDLASTPAGAKAVFEENIANAREAANQMGELYKQNVANLNAAKKNLENATKTKTEVENMIISKSNNGSLTEDQENMLARKLQNAMDDIEGANIQIKKYEPLVKSSKEDYERAQSTYESLISESDRVVAQMEADKAAEDYYSKRAKINSDASSELLDRVRKNASKTNDKATGAREIYNNSDSVQYDKIKKETRNSEARKRIEELKNRKNNGTN